MNKLQQADRYARALRYSGLIEALNELKAEIGTTEAIKTTVAIQNLINGTATKDMKSRLNEHVIAQFDKAAFGDDDEWILWLFKRICSKAPFYRY